MKTPALHTAPRCRSALILAGSIAALLCGLSPLGSPSAQAASLSIWNGGGANNLWSNPLNWSSHVPVPGTAFAFRFAGTTRLTPSNDFAAASDFASITFNAGAGAFTLSGNSITLNAAVAVLNSSSNTQTINNAIILASGNHQFNSGGNNNTVIAGDISGSGASVDVTIGNSLNRILTLSGNNSYAGGTTVGFRTLDINSNTALGTGGLTLSRIHAVDFIS